MSARKYFHAEHSLPYSYISPTFENQMRAAGGEQRPSLESRAQKTSTQKKKTTTSMSLARVALSSHRRSLCFHPHIPRPELGPTEDSITSARHVDKICRPIVKEYLLPCQYVICCSLRKGVLQHITRAVYSHAFCSHANAPPIVLLSSQSFLSDPKGHRLARLT